MSTYRTKNNYRAIYERAYGPILEGYEIHHIDGNHNNNDISNLIAVTMQEHYDIHFRQEDYNACMLIAHRMQKGSNFLKELSKKRVENGTHNFLGGEIQRQTSSKLRRKEVEEGRHHFVMNHPSKIKVTCPHCNKIGDKPNMMRYHFDNCKSQA